MLSILICTIEERKQKFDFIYNKLQNQINKLSLSDNIKIECFCDKRGEHSIGHKRNVLLQNCNTKYSCFIDDDDDVSDNYISVLYKGIKSKKDCIGLKGRITVNGGSPKIFIHSISYNNYFEENNIYYRPPNHLNVIKTSISKKFMFPDKNFGEDTDWAMDICNSGLIKTEYNIEDVIYFYNFVSKK